MVWGRLSKTHALSYRPSAANESRQDHNTDSSPHEGVKSSRALWRQACETARTPPTHPEQRLCRVENRWRRGAQTPERGVLLRGTWEDGKSRVIYVSMGVCHMFYGQDS